MCWPTSRSVCPRSSPGHSWGLSAWAPWSWDTASSWSGWRESRSGCACGGERDGSQDLSEVEHAFGDDDARAGQFDMVAVDDDLQDAGAADRPSLLDADRRVR